MPLSSFSDSGGALVSSELVREAAPPRGLSVVRIVMLKDGHGITSHLPGPPLEIRPREGEVLDISSDLATNWGGAGYCRPVDEEPPVDAGDTSPSAQLDIRGDVDLLLNTSPSDQQVVFPLDSVVELPESELVPKAAPKAVARKPAKRKSRRRSSR